MLPRATPTLPGRGALWSEEPGSFLSVVRSSGARVGNTPRALEGAGAEGRPRAPDRQSLGTYVNRSPTVQADGSNGRPTTLQNCNGGKLHLDEHVPNGSMPFFGKISETSFDKPEDDARSTLAKIQF